MYCRCLRVPDRSDTLCSMETEQHAQLCKTNMPIQNMENLNQIVSVHSKLFSFIVANCLSSCCQSCILSSIQMLGWCPLCNIVNDQRFAVLNNKAPSKLLSGACVKMNIMVTQNLQCILRVHLSYVILITRLNTENAMNNCHAIVEHENLQIHHFCFPFQHPW